MNIVLLESSDFVAAQDVQIAGRRALHIREVLSASVGDTLRVGKIDSLCGTGIVTAVGEKHISLSVEFDQPAPSASNISVLMALPRPKILRRALRIMAELGVKDIALFNSWRVEKSYWQSPLLARDKITECFKLGLEQAGDTIMPRLRLERRFKPFVEDELANWLGRRAAIMGHPKASTPFNDALRKRLMTQECVLAIGPEGGLIPYEVDALQRAGFEAFSLGARPLRVDTVLPYLLGALHNN